MTSPEYQAPIWVNEDDPDFIEGVSPDLGAGYLNDLSGAVEDHGQRLGAAESDVTTLQATALDQADGDARYILQSNANAFAPADATTTALAGKQPLDPDLTALAGLGSATAGTVATDGSGWVKKTYAQLKTALGLATVATSGKLADATDVTTTGAAVGRPLAPTAVDGSGNPTTYGYVSLGSVPWPAASTQVKSYDPARALYNATPDTLRRWRQALARARAGTQSARLNCYGDSITWGQYATPSAREGGWVGQLRELLDADYGSAGTGVVWGLASAWSADDTRLTYAGTNDQVGYGLFNLGTKRFQTGSITFGPVTCDAFKIYYVQQTTALVGATTLRAVVDGGTPVDTSPGGATENTYASVTIPAGTLGDHTLTISRGAGSANLYIAGVEALIGNSGVRTTAVAYPGKTAATFNADSSDGTAGYQFGIGAIPPDLSVIFFGHNEYLGSQSVATFKSAVSTLIDRVAASGDVLLVTQAPNGNTSLTPAQLAYNQAAYELADSKNVALLDLDALWQSRATSVANYYDQSHPNNQGYLDIAGAVHAAIRPGGDSKTSGLDAADVAPRVTSGDAFRIMPRGSAYAVGFDKTAGLGYFATTGLFTSTDNIALTTRALPTGVASGADVGKVVRFGANVYCQAKDASGFVKVFQSPPPGADLVWTQVHATIATGALGPALSASSWGVNDYLYLCEYGDPVGGPSAYRSVDGVTWETIIGPIAGLRHFHAIAADPYRPGHVYLNGGDGQSKVLWRSTNYGAPGSWTQLITDNTFQSVQISFSKDWVYFAGDTGLVSVYVLDRDNPTQPKIASANYHGLTPVPGGLPGRGIYTDAVLTGASATLTSATAAFTPSDVGKMIRFANVFANIDQTGGVWIAAYQSATAVTLNKPATGSQTARQFFIDGDSYYRNAFFGAVDPKTGVYYCVSNDSSSGGTRSGLFALTQPGGRLELLESYPTQTPGEIFFWNGSLWCHQARHSLLTIA